MKTIAISGVIGWDVYATDIRAQLKDAGKEEITVEISSPGGLVFDGLEIFNLIKNYPGKKTCHLMGLAASMASYIALAGDRVTAEANAVYMIHNAMGIAIGNHTDMRKTADILDSLSGVLAQAYAAKTKKSLEECRALMDAETYLYGNEIKDAGFVDEIIGEPTTDKTTALSLALANVSACSETVRKLSDEESSSKIAAMLPQPQEVRTPAAAGKSASAEIPKQEVIDMENPVITTLDALAKAYPDLVAAAVKSGASAESARVAELTKQRGINAEIDKIVDEAIVTGATYAEMQPRIVAAAAPQTQENPPPVTTGQADTLPTIEGMTAEDIKALKAMGLTNEQIKANAPKGV